MPPVPSTNHFAAMMGPLGMYQHAKYAKPRLEEGYCTDDNARASQLLMEWRINDPAGALSGMGRHRQRCWQFVAAAQIPDGRFRNFRSAQGEWLDNAGSEDTQARVARALTTGIIGAWREQRAQAMLNRLLPHLERLSCPRGIAEAIIALSAVPGQASAKAVLKALWSRLWHRWQQNASPDWPWPEPQLTYANALLPHGLLAGAAALNCSDKAVFAALTASVTFLVATTYRQGHFAPVGTAGWYRRGSTPARYDQQPIEAHTTLDLLYAYARLWPGRLPQTVLAAPYDWFRGRNSQGAILVDMARGACYDGLTPRGVNQNQGAESLLAYLRSELLTAREQFTP
jgi:hypothetical protein